MEVKDHLLFETYDEFYQSLIDKISDRHNRIALYDDLTTISKWREKFISRQRSKIDSRIIKMLPMIVKQMRNFVEIMRRRR